MNIISSKVNTEMASWCRNCHSFDLDQKNKTVVQPNRLKQVAPKRLSTENQKT